MLQILPRETQKTSSPKIATSPKIVDITSSYTQTSTAAQTIPDKKIECKTIETQTEIPIFDKKDKKTSNYN